MPISKTILRFSVPCAAILLLTNAPPGFPSDQVPAPKQKNPIAIVGATVHTVSAGSITGGTVLFVDGKIAAVGTEVNLPADVEQIDASDRHVYPGLISANTALGLVEVSAVRSTRDYAESGEFNPNVRSEVSFNPDSELLPVTRANGILMALSVPLSGVISGTSALMMLDGWTWEDVTLRAPVGLHLNWPRMAVSRSPFIQKSEKEQLKERDEKLQEIRDVFTQARAYLTAKTAEENKNIPYHDTDLRWEAMIPVLKKEIPVLIHASGIQEIQAAVDWALSADLRIVIVSGRDTWRVTDLLKEHNIPVIISGISGNGTRRWEDYDVNYKAPLRLHEAGVKFCIASSGGAFMAAHERNLPFIAALAAAYGLPKEEALKAVTLYPAEILGVADRVGSITVGKDASLIITNGHPLEIRTQVEMAFIQGRKIVLESRHTQLYEKYQKKYERMGLTHGR